MAWDSQHWWTMRTFCLRETGVGLTRYYCSCIVVHFKFLACIMQNTYPPPCKQSATKALCQPPPPPLQTAAPRAAAPLDPVLAARAVGFEPGTSEAGIQGASTEARGTSPEI